MRLLQNKAFYWSLCGLLVVTIAVTHISFLSTVPRGLNIDEVGMAYDAWSVSKTGHDSYLHSWPVYFLNRGDGMSPLYVYLESGIIALFGVSVAGMRAPAVIASFITLLAGAYIVRAQWSGRRMPLLLYLFMFAVVPYFTMYSRIALDCNLFLPFSLLLLATIVYNLRRKKPRWWLTGIVAGVTLYTYILSWIIVPLFLLLFTIYLLWCRRFSWRRVAQIWLPLCLLALPLVGVVAVNFAGVAQFTVGPFTVPQLVQNRSSDFGFALRNLRYMLDSLLLGDNVFIYADPHFTPFQYLSIPFAFIGLAFCGYRFSRAFRRRRLNIAVLLCLWFLAYVSLASFMSGATGQGPIMHQLNGLYGVTLLFIVWGIVEGFDLLRERLLHSRRWRAVPAVFLGGLVVAYTVLFGLFSYDYFVTQPRSWDAGVTNMNISGALGSLTADYPSLGDAIAYLNTLPPQVRDRATYIRHVQIPEVYYLLSQRVPASEIYQQRRVDGRVWYYRNFVFEKPMGYVLTENYIVANWQGPELTQLKSMGFSDVKRFGKYWVFVNP